MMSGIFGAVGVGKSVLLAKCAYLAQQGKPYSVGGYQLHRGEYNAILTNFPCSGCYRLDPETLGVVDYQNCLFLIDEASMIADSRAFKSFSDDMRYFFSQHRKGENDIIWCSQSYDDTDKKIRNLTTKYFYLHRSPIFSEKLTLISPIEQFTDVRDGKILSGYELAPPIYTGFVWMPRYWDMMDTHATIGHHALTKMQLTEWNSCDIIELKKQERSGLNEAIKKAFSFIK